MRLLSIIRCELIKMFWQKGTYAGYALLAVFVGLFVWGVWAAGPPEDVARRVGDEMAVGGRMVTGPLIPYILLVQVPFATYVFIPMLIAMVAGGLVAGEAQRGTLRTMVTRPVRRLAIIIGKLIAAFTYTATLALFMGVFALAAGWAVFGGGDIIAMARGELRIIPQSEALLRLALCYGLAAVMLWSVAAIALLCSTVLENPLVASGVTVGFLFVSGTLMAMPSLDWLKPYLLTSHLDPFASAFKSVIDWSAVARELGYTAIYGAIGTIGALIVFWRKDITC